MLPSYAQCGMLPEITPLSPVEGSGTLCRSPRHGDVLPTFPKAGVGKVSPLLAALQEDGRDGFGVWDQLIDGFEGSLCNNWKSLPGDR